eukprot:scaffold46533_cov66-Phaeocystis_antarctica.AAC.6
MYRSVWKGEAQLEAGQPFQRQVYMQRVAILDPTSEVAVVGQPSLSPWKGILGFSLDPCLWLLNGRGFSFYAPRWVDAVSKEAEVVLRLLTPRCRRAIVLLGQFKQVRLLRRRPVHELKPHHLLVRLAHTERGLRRVCHVGLVEQSRRRVDEKLSHLAHTPERDDAGARRG